MTAAATITMTDVPAKTDAHTMAGALATPPAVSEQERTLALLLAWFSPALPIGAFSYSHGLEALFEAGRLDDRAAVFRAIEEALLHGSGWSDAVLLAHAYAASLARDGARFEEVAAFAMALSPSRERREESVNQGTAIAEVTGTIWAGETLLEDGAPVALPAAVGAAGAAHGLAVQPLAQAYLCPFAANLVSAAVRLVPLGQTDGQRLVRDLNPVAAAVARRAIDADLGDVGGASIGLDLASMRHETQHVRLFRSWSVVNPGRAREERKSSL